MQFESLKVFCDVVRCRSFSQAATLNDLTQSAASQIVLQLERRIGVQLIDRSTRPLQPTPQGQVYYEGCKRLVEDYMELEASIREAPSSLAVNVQVAAIYSVGLGDMGQLVDSFTRQHPGARVQLEYLHPDRVYDRVLDGTADFGLVSFPRSSRELSALPWREEEMVLACAPQHPLADFRGVRPAQLDGMKYVGFDRHLPIRRHVDRFLKEHAVSVEIALEFDNIENIKKAVEVSAGVALLPEPTIRREVRDGALVAIPLTGCRFVRPLGIILRRSHTLSATASHFLEMLQESSNPGSPGRANGTPQGRNGAPRKSKRTVAR